MGTFRGFLQNQLNDEVSGCQSTGVTLQKDFHLGSSIAVDIHLDQRVSSRNLVAQFGGKSRVATRGVGKGRRSNESKVLVESQTSIRVDRVEVDNIPYLKSDDDITVSSPNTRISGSVEVEGVVAAAAIEDVYPVLASPSACRCRRPR